MILDEILKKEEKFTFLVGAGCSVDPPSCLPTGPKMIETMIKIICPESEIEEILCLSDLRFEQIIEIIRDRLDSNLKILDYYSLCDKPNLQHFFLAEMIKEGHFVMTTNFDFLIEYALLQQGLPGSDIIPVITKKDYQMYSNPHDLIVNGKKPLYKVHGSTRNIITEENTRDSLIATIRAFGTNKEGKNIFQVEPFKRSLFENISNKRSLIVMGYSGSDDFDIIPTLKLLKNFKNIIWVNHSQELKMEKLDNIDIRSIREIVAIQFYDELSSLDKKLFEIWSTNKNFNIYRIDVNTSEFVKKLTKINPKLNSDYFSTRFDDWLKENIGFPEDFLKYFIAFQIYNDFSVNESSMRCLEKLKYLAENSGNQYWECNSICNMGLIYYKQGKYTEALRCYEKALEIAEKIGETSMKAVLFNSIGATLSKQGNYQKALKMYKIALVLNEQTDDVFSKATNLLNVGSLYKNLENYSEAIKWYKMALEIEELFGNLLGKAVCLNNIGEIYKTRENYEESLIYLEEALEINDQLGNLSGKLININNIGFIFHMTEQHSKALTWYENALNIAEKLGELPGVASVLNNIASIYFSQDNFSEALTQFEKVLAIFKKSGDLSNMAASIANISMLYQKQKNYNEAINQNEIALPIVEQLGELSSKLALLSSNGENYHALGDQYEALKNFKEALKISDQIDDLHGKAFILNNIGVIYREEQRYSEAIEIFKEASEINEIIGKLLVKAININNIGLTLYALGDFKQALIIFEEAFEICKEIGEISYATLVKKNIEAIKYKL